MPAALMFAAIILTLSLGWRAPIQETNLPGFISSADVQSFPLGPEDKLFDERRALAEYKANLQRSTGPMTVPPAGPPPAPNPP
jgi:hypothetical protein